LAISLIFRGFSSDLNALLPGVRRQIVHELITIQSSDPSSEKRIAGIFDANGVIAKYSGRLQ
jgi:hypothetical protein